MNAQGSQPGFALVHSVAQAEMVLFPHGGCSGRKFPRRFQPIRLLLDGFELLPGAHLGKFSGRRSFPSISFLLRSLFNAGSLFFLGFALRAARMALRDFNLGAPAKKDDAEEEDDFLTGGESVASCFPASISAKESMASCFPSHFSASETASNSQIRCLRNRNRN